MPLDCPHDHVALVADGVAHACPRCAGVLIDAADFASLLPGAADRLASDEAVAIDCVGCGRRMTAARLGRLETRVTRCVPCGWYWLRRGQLEALRRAEKQAARERAYASLPAEDRRELARGLGDSAAGEPSLSPLHAVLAWCGFAVVTGIPRRRLPVATVGLALLIVLLFLSGVDTREMAYDPRAQELWPAVTALFAHAGWWHLIGNVYFLFAFGDALEQRVGPFALAATFLGLGALSMALQGLAQPEATYVLGASGGVSALIGACVVLQPQARVLTRIAVLVLDVRIVTYAVIESVYQLVMWQVGSRNIAWVAHLAGLALGAALGGVMRWRAHGAQHAA